MMWAKKIAAGVLAAALSLTLLSGCSGDSDKAKAIPYEASASYRFIAGSNSMCSARELECTNTEDGTKLYAAQRGETYYYVGTDDAGVLEVRKAGYAGTDKSNNQIAAGIYTVDRKANTYKDGGAFGKVERVLGGVVFNSREKQDGYLKKVLATSRTKDEELYYVEILKFDYGTAEVYYATSGRYSDNPNDLVYIEVYLPGEKTACAKFDVKATSSGSFNETAHSSVSQLTKAA